MPRRAVRPGVRTASRYARVARRYWSYCWGTLAAPRRTTKLISSSGTVGEGVTMASVFGSLYALGALTSYLIGRKPSGRTLKMIPAERYYLWQAMWTLPMTLLQYTLNAAFARQLSKRAGGTGRIGSDFTVLAFTQSMPLIVAMWLPDMSCYLSRVDEQLYLRLFSVYGPAATAWAFAMSAQGLAASERIRWPVALRTVLISEVASSVASGVAVAMR